MRKDLFSQIFDFLLFVFMNLYAFFKSEKKIKIFLIKELIENENFSIISQIFIKFHINLHLILKENNDNCMSVINIKKLYLTPSDRLLKNKNFQSRNINICK